MPTQTDQAPTRAELGDLHDRLAAQLAALDEKLSDVDEQLSTAAAEGAQLPDRALLAERRELLDSQELVGAEHAKVSAEIARLDEIAAAEKAERERVEAEARAARERAAAAAEAHRLSEGWPAALEAAGAAVRAAVESLVQHRADLATAVRRAGGEGGTLQLEDRTGGPLADVPRARVWMAVLQNRNAQDVAERLAVAAYASKPAPPAPPAVGAWLHPDGRPILPGDLATTPNLENA